MTVPNFPEPMIRTYIVIAITAAGFLLSTPLQWIAPKCPEATVRPLSLLSPIFGDNMVLQRAR